MLFFFHKLHYLFKTFLIVVSARPVLPRKHAPKILSLVGRKDELEFPFAYLLVFKLNNLKIYTDLFWFLRDGSVQ